MQKFVVALLASIVLLGFSDFAQASPEYTAIDLGTLGGVTSQGAASFGFGINNAGQIAGTSVLSDNTTNRAFLYSGGSLQDLGTLGGSTSSGFGINNTGDVVGQADTASGDRHAFFFSGGTMHDLGTLGGSNSSAVGINDSGEIVGSSTTSGKTNSHAFLYSSGAMHDLGTLGGKSSSAFGINDAGQVVGLADTTGGQSHAFLYSGGSMQDLGTLGGTKSLAFAINNSGAIVGGSQTATGGFDAFLYSGGSMHDLGTLNGDEAVATGINSSGEIAGTLFLSGSTITGKLTGIPVGAFLYVSGTMYNLNSLLVGSHIDFIAAFGINDKGQIAADGRLANGQIRGFLLNPFAPHVPDAGSAVLLLGIALIALVRLHKICAALERKAR
ncbi:MAG: HAF repeat-containing protein [Verrucomicrobia bacterium]|nr:HAF repeat-containing protein [Verrucomicrobiota bacterium]